VSASFDFTELDALIADMGDVPRRLHANVRKAVQVSAQDVRDDWRGASRSASGRHARAYPFAIDYDIEGRADGITAEVGPNTDKKHGTLGFLEEGVAEMNTSPQNASRLAVKANQDNFIRGILMAGGDSAEV
jgi:hypothetical protein